MIANNKCFILLRTFVLLTIGNDDDNIQRDYGVQVTKIADIKKDFEKQLKNKKTVA
jgi:hypothetical protein